MTSEIKTALQRKQELIIRPQSTVEEVLEKSKTKNLGAMIWLLGQNDDQAIKWFAKSQDGLRQYEIYAEGPRPRQEWHIRYQNKGIIEHVLSTFRNEWECKNAAEVIEAGYPIDREALQKEKAHFDALLTRGGKKWDFYGVIDNKQIWAYRSKGAKSAYVIVYDYRTPQYGWTVSVRTWFKTGRGIRKLKIETIANCQTLEEAQNAILRITN